MCVFAVCDRRFRISNSMLSIIALLLAAAASSGAAYFDGYNNVSSQFTPKQVRMSYQGPTAMMISWNTFGKHISHNAVLG